MLKRLHLLVALLVLAVNTAMAQITTSGISGKITADGENVIGATVTATHQPSGTVYRAVTNIDGRYIHPGYATRRSLQGRVSPISATRTR